MPHTACLPPWLPAVCRPCPPQPHPAACRRRRPAQLMAPNTATALKESKRNQLKDFVNVAGPLGVTHFLILTATHNASYLRVAK